MTTATLPDLAAAELSLLIGGERVDAASGERFDVLNPATGELLATVPAGGAADVDAAVAAARAALPVWQATPPSRRAELLWNLGTRIAELSDELATIEALDNGKTRADALMVDIPLSSEIFRYYAGWATKIEGATIPPSSGIDFHIYTRREPVGVVGAIIPWNFPLLMCAYKMGPALAAGNTIIVKPAEQTPLSALRLAGLCVEAGVPEGVVQVVTGDGRTGAALAAHPDVHKVAFTGSTEVGRAVMGAAAQTVKRVTLELGGKNPNVVFADADLDAAVEGAMAGAFENGGQACIAGSRLLAERAVCAELVERLRERADALVVGPGWEDGVHVGPLVSAEQRARVLGHVQAAEAAGARRVTAEPALDGPGHFARPAVLDAVDPSMAIFRDEVFGPVVTVTPFDGEEEAVALANDTRYGLSAGVWTGDVARAVRMARAIRAGTVWINAYGSIRPEVPFGGFGESGLGRELGAHALTAYTELKSVFVSAA